MSATRLTRGRWLLAIVLLGSLTAVEVRILNIAHAINQNVLEGAAQGVLAGRPYFRNYQSRILGPILVDRVAKGTGWSYHQAYDATGAALLLLANLACFWALVREGTWGKAWQYTLASAGVFVAMQDRYWFYIWDYVNALVLFLVAWAVMKRARPVVMVGLFGLEIVNHEVGLLIPLWIALQGVALRRGTLRIVSWSMAVGGLLLAGLGVAMLQALRERLFIESAITVEQFGVTTFGDSLLMLPRLLDVLMGRGPLGAERQLLDVFTLFLGLGGTLVLLWRAWPTLGDQAWRVVALLAALIASILLFGLVKEPRVGLVLLPFGVWLAWSSEVEADRLSAAGLSGVVGPRADV